MKILAGALLLAGLAFPAAAQQHLEGRIGLGIGAGPDYEGSDEYKPTPIVPLSLRWHGIGLQTAGQGLQFDILPSRLVNFGPTVQYKGGRRDVEDAVVARLPEIDPTVAAGGFVEINLPFFAPGRDAITLFARATHDVGGVYDGWRMTPGVRYSLPLGDKWRVNFIAETRFVSDSYNDTYFSVTPAGSALSGLPVFAAEGGVENVSGTLAATYFFADHWGVQGVARYSRLLNDAAASPIVSQRGSKHQFLGGFALVYKF